MFAREANSLLPCPARWRSGDRCWLPQVCTTPTPAHGPTRARRWWAYGQTGRGGYMHRVGVAVADRVQVERRASHLRDL